MELEKFNRQLKLMSMLAGNISLNVEQVARRLIGHEPAHRVQVHTHFQGIGLVQR